LEIINLNIAMGLKN